MGIQGDANALEEARGWEDKKWIQSSRDPEQSIAL
jgi:hypothetical protein